MTPLSVPMAQQLWRLAQHKYGWGYVEGIGKLSSARALERRGLARDLGNDEGHAYRMFELTEAGMVEVKLRFPKSPAALKTYVRPEGGWDPRP